MECRENDMRARLPRVLEGGLSCKIKLQCVEDQSGMLFLLMLPYNVRFGARLSLASKCTAFKARALAGGF